MPRALLLLLLIAACRSTAPTTREAPAAAIPTLPRLTLLGVGALPAQDFENTRVGGLSALVYDDKDGLYYALSDDKGDHGAPRIYSLRIDVVKAADGYSVTPAVVSRMTILDEAGAPLALHSIDPEGLALAADGSFLVSSEGFAQRGVQPFIAVVGRSDGRIVARLPVPEAFLVDVAGPAQERGVRDNFGFEALTRCGDRILAFAETPLAQDSDWQPKGPRMPARMVVFSASSHQVLGSHVYPVDGLPPGALVQGVTAALCLDDTILTLERSWGEAVGFGLRLYATSLAGASDVTALPALTNAPFTPMTKELVLDVGALPVRKDNLEGMTLGAPLPDGSRPLIIVSDDNFKPEQVTEFLVFSVGK